MSRIGWQIVIVLLIGGSLACDKTVTRSYQAWVALDGKGPLGLTDPPWDGPDAVVLYRTGHNGVVCFDGFHSKDLHDRLLAKNGKPVIVEYDTFGGSGKVSGYNVLSVDGIMLANGRHVLREDYSAAAGVMRRGEGNASGDDCW